MKILFIGGSRFTGAKLVNQFASSSHQVTVFNRGNHDRPTDNGVTYVVGDRRDKGAIEDLFDGCSFDAIVDTCAYEPADVEPLFRAKCEPDRYICYSTAGVYSEDNIVPFNEDDDRGDNHFWDEYGTAKAALEDRLFDAYEKSNFPTTILRFPYIYGPGNHLYRETALFDRVRKDGLVPIPGDGQSLLQFVYVDDVIRAVAAVVESEHRQPVGEAYNVGEPRSYTYRKVVSIVADIADVETATVSFDTPQTATEVFDLVPFGSRHLFMNTSKWSEFVDQDFTTLQDGLTETLAWYKEVDPDYDDEYVL